MLRKLGFHGYLAPLADAAAFAALLSAAPAGLGLSYASYRSPGGSSVYTLPAIAQDRHLETAGITPMTASV